MFKIGDYVYDPGIMLTPKNIAIIMGEEKREEYNGAIVYRIQFVDSTDIRYWPKARLRLV